MEAKSSTVDVAAEGRGVGEDRVVPDPAVVGHVGVGHEQVVGADLGDAAAEGRAEVDGHELVDGVAVADHEAARLPPVLQVLGNDAHRAEREEMVLLAEGRVAVDDRVGVDRRYGRPGEPAVRSRSRVPP